MDNERSTQRTIDEQMPDLSLKVKHGTDVRKPVVAPVRVVAVVQHSLLLCLGLQGIHHKFSNIFLYFLTFNGDDVFNCIQRFYLESTSIE